MRKTNNAAYNSPGDLSNISYRSTLPRLWTAGGVMANQLKPDIEHSGSIDRSDNDKSNWKMYRENGVLTY